jgi:hypothetical protein
VALDRSHGTVVLRRRCVLQGTVLLLKRCGLREGGGRALAETLRLITTVTSLDLAPITWENLFDICLEDGGGRALAEALRLNNTATSLNLRAYDLSVEVRLALRQVWVGEGHWS